MLILIIGSITRAALPPDIQRALIVNVKLYIIDAYHRTKQQKREGSVTTDRRA